MKSPLIAVIALAGVVVALAACGGSGPSSSGVAALPSPSAGPGASASGTASPNASDQVAQALAYAQCIRSNGVPAWPDPDSSGQFDKSKLTTQQLGAGDAQVQVAQTACQQVLPTNMSGPTQAQIDQHRSDMLRYVGCMRAHGISTMPDPDSRGHLDIGPGTSVDVNTPQFQAAYQACLSTLAAPPSSPSP